MKQVTRNKLIPVVLLLTLSLLGSFIFYLIQLYFWEIEKNSSTRFFQQSFLSSIHQYEYLPSLLSRDSLVKLGLTYTEYDSADLNNRLKFIAQRSGLDAVYVMNISGLVIAASNFDQDNSFFQQNYAFRPYFSNAIIQRKRQFYYAIGATTGIPGFFISEPIITNDGSVLGVVVVKLELSDWEQSWKDAGQDILVADNNGVIILSSRENWRYHSIGQLSATSLQSIKQSRQLSGIQPESIYQSTYQTAAVDGYSILLWLIDNALYLVNDYPITDTGWTLYSLENNSKPVSASLVFGLLLLTLMGLGLLYWNERQSKLRSRQQSIDNEKKYRRELEAVIENIHIGVVLLDQQGIMSFMNDAARQLLNIQPAENEQLKIQQCLDVSNINNFEQLLTSEEETIIKPFHETCVRCSASAPVPVMFAISQLPIGGEQRLLMTLVNIEKRKRAEQTVIQINATLEEQVEQRTHDLREAQAELVQQSKVAALGQMAATIVHELSQPLSAMNSSIAAVQFKAEKQDWSGALKSIDRLAPLSVKMQNVIKLLKSFSYQDEKQPERQQLAPLISQSLTLYKDSLHEKNIAIHLQEMAQSVFVRVNPLKLDLVIVNIIQNAIDAMDKCEQPSISVGMNVAEEYALITIEDIGGGIDSRVMGQLFNPYFTTKEIGKGLGLGLSICYEIMQEYSGTIDAENTGQGARFIISLPLDMSSN